MFLTILDVCVVNVAIPSAQALVTSSRGTATLVMGLTMVRDTSVAPGWHEPIAANDPSSAGPARQPVAYPLPSNIHCLRMLSTSDELNALLDKHPFTNRHGMRVVALDDGECEILVPYRPDYDRPGGIVSGQVSMHAADVAFWLAIKTRLGMDDPSVTSSMTTTFLAPVSGVELRCRARLIKVGRTLVYGWAECIAAGRLVTHHTLTYARL